MANEDLLDFVSAYPSNESRARIVVSDRNSEFRQRVAAYVVENPASAPAELVRDLVEHEAVWGRSSDNAAPLVAKLLSYLLNAEGVGELTTLLSALGHNMDLDGLLQTGGLTLEESTRDALKAALQRSGSSHPRVALAKKVVDSAGS